VGLAGNVLNYSEWETGVSVTLTQDVLWKVTAYRRALFATDLGWDDVTALSRDRRTVGLSDQLYRALGSVSANIAEGFSRGSTKDRARFYEYALGSARESRDWYFKGRHLLGIQVSEHRMQLQTEIIRLLLRMIPDERGYRVGEDPASYTVPFGTLGGSAEDTSHSAKALLSDH
jgi:four helix bundle protein